MRCDHTEQFYPVNLPVVMVDATVKKAGFVASGKLAEEKQNLSEFAIEWLCHERRGKILGRV